MIMSGGREESFNAVKYSALAGEKRECVYDNMTKILGGGDVGTFFGR